MVLQKMYIVTNNGNVSFHETSYILYKMFRKKTLEYKSVYINYQ